MAPIIAQTMLRIPEPLMVIIKESASKEGQSVNTFVAAIIAAATKSTLAKLPEDYQISDEVRQLCGFIPSLDFPEEVLESDPKLAKILGK